MKKRRTIILYINLTHIAENSTQTILSRRPIKIFDLIIDIPYTYNYIIKKAGENNPQLNATISLGMAFTIGTSVDLSGDTGNRAEKLIGES